MSVAGVELLGALELASVDIVAAASHVPSRGCDQRLIVIVRLWNQLLLDRRVELTLGVHHADQVVSAAWPVVSLHRLAHVRSLSVMLGTLLASPNATGCALCLLVVDDDV